MAVSVRACFWCHVRLDQVRDDLAVRGFGNAQVAVEKKTRKPPGTNSVSPGLTWANWVVVRSIMVAPSGQCIKG